MKYEYSEEEGKEGRRASNLWTLSNSLPSEFERISSRSVAHVSRKSTTNLGKEALNRYSSISNGERKKIQYNNCVSGKLPRKLRKCKVQDESHPGSVKWGRGFCCVLSLETEEALEVLEVVSYFPRNRRVVK